MLISEQKAPLSGILKQNVSTKYEPTSPKKVQFNSLMEVHSKSSGDTLGSFQEDEPSTNAVSEFIW